MLLQDGSPLRLNMWGFNLYTDGHFDLYIADYYDYKVRPPRYAGQILFCVIIIRRLS